MGGYGEHRNDLLHRILAFEASRENYFRQHITDIKKELVKQLSANSDEPDDSEENPAE